MRIILKLLPAVLLAFSPASVVGQPLSHEVKYAQRLIGNWISDRFEDNARHINFRMEGSELSFADNFERKNGSAKPSMYHRQRGTYSYIVSDPDPRLSGVYRMVYGNGAVCILKVFFMRQGDRIVLHPIHEVSGRDRFVSCPNGSFSAYY